MATRAFTMDRAGGVNARLTVEIMNHRPLELADMTRGFLGLAEEFQHFIERDEPETAAGEVKLYIQEIRSGSIIADLVAVSPQLIQSVSHINAVINFGKHLKNAYGYLTGKSESKPRLDKESYQNLANLVEPIANDHGSQLNIGIINGPVHISLNSTDANAAQNSARKELEKLKEPNSSMHEKVVLYWYQARADTTSKAGDRGIIESISPNPVKVICVSDAIKLQMIFEQENPFKEAYIVDVVVETIKGKPALYKIIAIHDKFERDVRDE